MAGQAAIRWANHDREPWLLPAEHHGFAHFAAVAGRGMVYRYYGIGGSGLMHVALKIRPNSDHLALQYPIRASAPCVRCCPKHVFVAAMFPPAAKSGMRRCSPDVVGNQQAVQHGPRRHCMGRQQPSASRDHRPAQSGRMFERTEQTDIRPARRRTIWPSRRCSGLKEA